MIMSKRYTYEEVMDLSEEEFDKLRSRHWFAIDISTGGDLKKPEKVFDNPYFKRELLKKGITGAIILGSVGIACVTAVKIAEMFRDND
jgi:hypothetical protein